MARRTAQNGFSAGPGPSMGGGFAVNPEPQAPPPPQPQPQPTAAPVEKEKSLLRKLVETLAFAGVSAIAGGVAWEWWKRRKAGKSDGDEDTPQAALPPAPTANPFGGGPSVSFVPFPMPMMPPAMYPPAPMMPSAFNTPEPLPRKGNRKPTRKDVVPLTEREELALLRERRRAKKEAEQNALVASIENGEFDDY